MAQSVKYSSCEYKDLSLILNTMEKSPSVVVFTENPSAGKVATDRSLGLAGRPETLCWLVLCRRGTR